MARYYADNPVEAGGGGGAGLVRDDGLKQRTERKQGGAKVADEKEMDDQKKTSR